MRRAAAQFRLARTWLLVVAVLLLAWLCVLAARPSAAGWLPAWLPDWSPGWVRRLGESGSAPTIAIVITVIVALSVLGFRSHSASRRGNVPVVVVVGLAATSAALGFTSYWSCHNDGHPILFQPLMWTVSLLKGGVTDFSMSGHVCPDPVPDALWIARLTALGALFIGLAGVAIALFRAQWDRMRASRAKSVTVVIGVDDETRGMISAIATTLDRSSTLVVITGGPAEPGVQEARMHGGRVVSVDFNALESLESLSLWRHLECLYLMSPDPQTNQLRLDTITRARAEIGHRQRLPLTVRIDDPWQAEAWRAKQLGGSDTQWAADAVGKYEVTARWLLDNIVEAAFVQQVYVCGASELTLALCADMTRRKLEHDFYSESGEPPPPALTLVGDDAGEYLRDHEFHRRQLGLASTGPTIDATDQPPTVSALLRLIGDGDGADSAVIFVDDKMRGPSNARSTGTRLAARFPAMPIYIWDSDAQMVADPIPMVGRLRTYRLALEVPEGQAQDVWERAAQLIHQRYIAALGPQPNPSAARLPWARLDEFYRGSNRRQVRNALWMVEQIAEHTWNTWGTSATPLGVHDMADLTAPHKLERMGFDHVAAMKMAEAEHQDWCRYYRRNHWRYGPVRNDEQRIHDKLVDWSVVEADSEMLKSALSSLAATLWSLRQLGYRSRPLWQRFTRIGTVTAEQLDTPWTWTSPSGHSMRADAGDWRVQADNDPWSVRDDLFRKSYEHLEGDLWRQRGTVFARPAHPGETIETLEGTTTATDGDWVVRGADGEQWPVPAQEFTERYSELDSDPSVTPSHQP